jgi:hypothetical protein
MQEASFDGSGKVTFVTKQRKPFNTERLQGAMFSDRPDLWKVPRKKRSPRIPKGQGKLL